jgi:hypothetical protein
MAQTIKKRPIPKGVLKRIPNGIERLNTLNCRYYAIKGYNARRQDWYEGMFMRLVYEWYNAEYIVDLQEGVWWKVPGWQPGPRHKEFVAGKRV